MNPFRQYLARLAARLQFLLPRYWLTAAVYRLARIRTPAVKDVLIRGFVRLYDVDIGEARNPVPDGFDTFNAFFTRELADGARTVDAEPGTIVSPADGTLSQAGTLAGNTILQAKGFDYSLEDLLVTDLDSAAAFRDGSFATIYLAPYNYHRVHAPFPGELRAMHYVPGDLFSVNTATAATIRGLFRRNERLILHFVTPGGPAVLIFVGALNVGSISTPWSGEIRPRKRGVVETFAVDSGKPQVDKGDLLGWFNMGSTVIILMPRGGCDWRPELLPGSTLRMGEAIGRSPGALA